MAPVPLVPKVAAPLSEITWSWQTFITVSAAGAGVELAIEEVMAWHGGPHTIEASQPAALIEELDVKTKIKHPLPVGLLAVYEGIIFVPE